VRNVTGTKEAVVINVKLLKSELDILFSEVLTACGATWDSCYGYIQKFAWPSARTKLMEVAHCLTEASRAQENENDNKRMNVESECPMFETQEISAATFACNRFDCHSSSATAVRAAAAAGQQLNFRESSCLASVSRTVTKNPGLGLNFNLCHTPLH